MKTKSPKLRINREVIAVLTSKKLEEVAGGAAGGKVHCCSRFTGDGKGQSTTSGSVLI